MKYQGTKRERERGRDGDRVWKSEEGRERGRRERKNVKDGGREGK